METEPADEHSPTKAPLQPAKTATVERAREVGEGVGEALAPETSIDEVDRLLDDVEAALARLDDGTYGRCGACGSVIDDSRLAATPTVQTCANCATVPADD